MALQTRANVPDSDQRAEAGDVGAAVGIAVHEQLELVAGRDAGLRQAAVQIRVDQIRSCTAAQGEIPGLVCDADRVQRVADIVVGNTKGDPAVAAVVRRERSE